MIAGRVQNVQLMDLAADAVQFPMEILDGRRVRIDEFVAEKTRNQRRFADTSRAADFGKKGWHRMVLHGAVNICMRFELVKATQTFVHRGHNKFSKVPTI